LLLSCEGGAHSLIVTLFLLIATHAKPKPGKLKVVSVNSLRAVVKITIIVTLKNKHFSLPHFLFKKKNYGKSKQIQAYFDVYMHAVFPNSKINS
jgi:hypothetical protein